MFLLLHSLSSPIDNYVYDAPSEINYPTVLRCPLQFYFFLIFSLYKLNVESFYWHVFKFTDSFLNCGQSTDVSIKETLHFPYNIFWLNISFWFFIRAGITLLTASICLCMLSFLHESPSHIIYSYFNFPICYFQYQHHIWVWCYFLFLFDCLLLLFALLYEFYWKTGISY